MTIILSQNYQEPNRINKTLQNSLTITNVILKDGNNIESPILEFIYDESILNYNYCEIIEFGRKYFISSIQVFRNNIFVLMLNEDVLSSFKNCIIESPIHVYRTNNVEKSNKNLNDNKNGITAKSNSTVLLTSLFKNIDSKYNYSATDYCYIVSCIGLNESYGDFGVPINNDSDLQSPPNPVFSGTNSFVQRYLLNFNELYKLCKIISDNSEYRSYIISIMAYPIFLETLFLENIENGNMSIANKPVGTFKRITNKLINIVESGEIYHARKYEDYRDFSPYTELSIYLPYIGIRNILPEYVYSGKLYYEVSINFTTGYIFYTLGLHNDGGASTVIATYDGIIGYSIPITTTNQQEIERQKAQIATSGAIGLAGSIATMAVGIGLTATGVGSPAGIPMIVGGAVSTVGSAVKLGVEYTHTPDPSGYVSDGGVISQGFYYMNQFIAVYIKEYESVNEPENIATVYGHASDYYGKISDFNIGDLIFIDYIHLEYPENLTKYPTSNENMKLEQIIKEGIIY